MFIAISKKKKNGFISLSLSYNDQHICAEFLEGDKGGGDYAIWWWCDLACFWWWCNLVVLVVHLFISQSANLLSFGDGVPKNIVSVEDAALLDVVAEKKIDCLALKGGESNKAKLEE